MELEVVDNGKGCDDVNKAMEHGGIGLRNVQDRLRTLYDQASQFLIGERAGGRGTSVTIVIPLVKTSHAH